VEVVQGLKEAKLDKIPIFFEISRTETVRAGKKEQRGFPQGRKAE
jgi:hypothetical protein